jgi:heme-degrading monooxygenase HmoA
MTGEIITDRTDNFSDAASGVKGAVMLINLFTTKPGMEDQFVEAQTAEYVRLKGKVPGFIGNRLGRAVDGNQIVNVAVFDSVDSYNAWRASDLFTEHLEIIRPLVENSSPGIYQLLYSNGDM